MSARIPIESCQRCLSIPQAVQTNHKQGQERLPALGELEEISAHAWSDDAGETHSRTEVLRCGDCRTIYLMEWFEDEGHSFMDPTSNETKDRRLTPVEAIDALGKHTWERGDADAARAEILASREAVVEGLRTLIVEGRAPNEHVVGHATACVLDAALDTGEHDDIRGVLARASDPMARVEALRRLRHLGLDIGIDTGTPSLRASAKAFLEEEDTGAFLTGELIAVLRQRPRPYRDSWKKDTHVEAGRVLGGLVGIRVPFHREVLEALLALLLDGDDAVVKAAVAAVNGTRYLHYSKHELEIGEAIAAWSKKHPGNVHGQKLASDILGEAEREAKRLGRK